MRATFAELFEVVKDLEAKLSAAVAERDELLYHTRHGSPDDLRWCAPKTVGHLRRQLETLDPNMAIGTSYFIEIGDRKVARTTGVSMSYERVNNQTNRIDTGNEDIPRGIIIWAHTTDAEGREAGFLAEPARLQELGHSLAYEFCVSVFNSDLDEDDWSGVVLFDEASASRTDELVPECIEYLTMRGLIERNAEKPNWFAVLDESEATA